EKFAFTYRRPLASGGFQVQNNKAVSLGGSTYATEQLKGISSQTPILQANVDASQALAVGLLARIQSNGDAYGVILTNSGQAEFILLHAASNSFDVLGTPVDAGTNSGALAFLVTGGATPTLTLFLNGNSTPLLTFTPTGPQIIASPGGVGIFA